MGQMDDAAISRKNKNRRSAGVEAQRGVRSRRERVVANWEASDGDILRSVIELVSDHDGALRLGRSRDGGSYAIGIYGDGEPYTEYIPATEDINAYLSELLEYWRALR